MKKLTLLNLLVFLNLFSTLFASSIKTDDMIEVDLNLAKGLDIYQTEAVVGALSEEINFIFNTYLTDSHFIYGPKYSKFGSKNPLCNNETKECRHDLTFDLSFRASSIDLNNDGVKEVIVLIEHSLVCGSGGCYTRILIKNENQWKIATEIFGLDHLYISNEVKYGLNFLYYSNDCENKEIQTNCNYKALYPLNSYSYESN